MLQAALAAAEGARSADLETALATERDRVARLQADMAAAGAGGQQGEGEEGRSGAASQKEGGEGRGHARSSGL
jgi:hypothetical protein